MKNKLIDLNNHLFAQLERLSDEDLTAEQIKKEASRAKAIVGVSSQIIKTADIALKGAKLVAETGGAISRYLPLVESTIGTVMPVAPAIEDKSK